MSRKQAVRIVGMVTVLLVVFAAFLGGYYYGRMEGFADAREHDTQFGRGLWETQGRHPELRE